MGTRLLALPSRLCSIPILNGFGLVSPLVVRALVGARSVRVSWQSTLWDQEKTGIVLAFVVPAPDDFTKVIDTGRRFQFPT